MKKSIYLLLVPITVAMLFTGALSAQARDGGGHGHGDSHGHGDRHGHSSHVDLWFGSGWGPGWDPWWWGAPGYPYYYNYYWPPVGYQEEPPVYVEPTPPVEEQTYWYFCPESRNYYPYVKKCPNGWLKVVPPSAPQDYEE